MLCLAAAVGLTAACASEDPKVAEARRAAEDTDQEVANVLAAPNHAEAREWLGRPAALGWKVSVNQMLKIVEELYAAGASTVYVTGIEEFRDRQIAAVLVVELPARDTARKALFTWQVEFAKATETEPARDVGQKFFKVILD
jgi:hypothetical protein